MARLWKGENSHSVFNKISYNAGLRVWNCLLEHKQMESKTIAERVLMPSQQTVNTLYRLLRGGFVAIQVFSCAIMYSRPILSIRLCISRSSSLAFDHLMQTESNI